MAVSRIPPLAKPVVGIITKEPDRCAPALGQLEKTIGSIAMVSDPIPFSYTAYYRMEMGEPLTRIFVIFRPLMPRDRLAALKHACSAIETSSAVIAGNRMMRTINLDPGYLTAANFILATHKEFPHRIYLGDRVFAEVTLFVRHGKWECLPWTYPDYQLTSTQNFLWAGRKELLRQLAEHRISPGANHLSADEQRPSNYNE